MNNEIEILKITNYDNFKCIADKCKFTCCEGWDIAVDNDTYHKWQDNKCDYILNNVILKKCENKKEYFINKEINKTCPLLDDEGLCEIVKNNGEDYLSLTCHSFPRIKNVFENKKELSLSCACPEVVEIISKISNKINLLDKNNNALDEELLELKIRETIIKIINENNASLDYKLIISFQMMLNILENEEITEEILLKELKRFKDKEYIKELIEMYEEVELDTYESIEEINNLFLDIIENYKSVSGLEVLLNDISDFAEEVDIASLTERWKEFKIVFEEYNNLIENCIISKVLSSCVSDDIEEMTINLEMIILEYLLTRHALFLKYCMNEITTEDVKDYIVCFSRVVGNNIEAVEEFIADGFDDEILEVGYLCFISIF